MVFASALGRKKLIPDRLECCGFLVLESMSFWHRTSTWQPMLHDVLVNLRDCFGSLHALNITDVGRS